MKVAVLFLLSLSAIYLIIITVLTAIYRPKRKRFNPPVKLMTAALSPPVSILKPVRGLDDELEENLESFYRLDYPFYEILFALDSWNDQACEVIRKVAAKYPQIPTVILAPGHDPNQNPKIHKLSRMESESRGRLLWITDSNVRVEPNTLSRLVAEYLSSGASLVFSPILGTSSRSFTSLMENASLNFFTSGNVIALWKLLAKPVVVGKSMLIDRVAIGSFGGFQFFKDNLAEDYLIGQSFLKKGFKVRTNFTWVMNINQQVTVQSFFKRLARWAKLRYQLNRPVYIMEIVLNPIVLALLEAAAFGPLFWQPVLLVTALKILLEYINFLAVNIKDRRRFLNHLLFPAAVVVKDFIFLAVYLTPFLSSTVDWRGGKIKVGKNSLICPTPAYEGYSLPLKC